MNECRCCAKSDPDNPCCGDKHHGPCFFCETAIHSFHEPNRAVLGNVTSRDAGGVNAIAAGYIELGILAHEMCLDATIDKLERGGKKPNIEGTVIGWIRKRDGGGANNVRGKQSVNDKDQALAVLRGLRQLYDWESVNLNNRYSADNSLTNSGRLDKQLLAIFDGVILFGTVSKRKAIQVDQDTTRAISKILGVFGKVEIESIRKNNNE